MKIIGRFILISVTLLSATEAYALKYKFTGRTGYGFVNYSAPNNSSNTNGILLGVGFDAGFSDKYSLGMDATMGYSSSDQVISFSNTDLVWKYYPLTYAMNQVVGTSEERVAVRSLWYPYVGVGLGLSTLIVKTRTSTSSTLTSVNTQYFNLMGLAGADIPFGDSWGMNTNANITWGAGSSSAGSQNAIGVMIGIGMFKGF